MNFLPCRFVMEEVLLLSRVEAGTAHCKPLRMELSGFCRRLTDEVFLATQKRCPIIFEEKSALHPLSTMKPSEIGLHDRIHSRQPEPKQLHSEHERDGKGLD